MTALSNFGSFSGKISIFQHLSLLILYTNLPINYFSQIPIILHLFYHITTTTQQSLLIHLSVLSAVVKLGRGRIGIYSIRNPSGFES